MFLTTNLLRIERSELQNSFISIDVKSTNILKQCRKKSEREVKLKAAQEADGLCLGSGSLRPRPDPAKNLTMKEELASKKAKINQGKEIDENNSNQDADDGRLKCYANLFNHRASTDTEGHNIHCIIVYAALGIFSLQMFVFYKIQTN